MRLFRKKAQLYNGTDVLDVGVFTGYAVSDIGLSRANNEDNYLLGKHLNDNAKKYSKEQMTFHNSKKQWHLLGVFDGMGGGEKGEVASGISAKVFREAFAKLKANCTKTDIDIVLRASFLEANNQIVQLQKKINIYGTTGSVICTNCVDFKIYHLGDSRVYLLRNGEMFRLTKDQTLAQMKIDAGLYNEGDSWEEEQHKLTEYIGRDWTRENLRPVESKWMRLQAGDRVLLCSDGLYDMCTDVDILKILRDSHLENAANSLVEAAIVNGGKDNVTCIVFGSL